MLTLMPDLDAFKPLQPHTENMPTMLLDAYGYRIVNYSSNEDSSMAILFQSWWPVTSVVCIILSRNIVATTFIRNRLTM